MGSWAKEMCTAVVDMPLGDGIPGPLPPSLRTRLAASLPSSLADEGFGNLETSSWRLHSNGPAGRYRTPDCCCPSHDMMWPNNGRISQQKKLVIQSMYHREFRATRTRWAQMK